MTMKQRIKGWLDERQIYFGGSDGWKRFRGYLYLGPRRPTLRVEWSPGHWSPALSLTVGSGDGDDGVSLHVGIPPMWFFVGADGVLPASVSKRLRHNPHAMGVRIFEGRIWFDLLQDQHEYNTRRDRFRSFNLPIVDWLLGRPVYSAEPIGKPEAVEIPMPERSYAATVQLSRCTWKRSRWPKATVITRAEVTIPEGLPFPGKGENAWDCGDDATSAASFPCDSVPEAIGHMVGSVLRDRWQRGGRDWRPPVEAPALKAAP